MVVPIASKSFYPDLRIAQIFNIIETVAVRMTSMEI